MHWLEKNHAILDCYNNKITCLDEEGKEGKVQGIPRATIVREISSMKFRKRIMKGCQIVSSHMEEETKDIMPSIGYHPILKYFEDVFGEIPGLLPKIDIDFSIYLVRGDSQVSKTTIYNGHTRIEIVVDVA
jgi:hypothetical protein